MRSSALDRSGLRSLEGSTQSRLLTLFSRCCHLPTTEGAPEGQRQSVNTACGRFAALAMLAMLATCQG
eukprot:1215070-Alexandrium_andersonii.AAC.1